MLFAIIRRDHAGAFALRQATRPVHLEYLAGVEPRIAYGGALVEAAGEGRQIGSILFVEADSLEEVERLAAADPFVAAGLFASTEIVPFRAVFRDGKRI
ncbi:MAG TPA: YciI family protein [Acetobacteraceae bacterium]|nr:YciI family protein [Acetobacteraceae bacterium]